MKLNLLAVVETATESYPPENMHIYTIDMSFPTMLVFVIAIGAWAVVKWHTIDTEELIAHKNKNKDQ